MEMDLEHKNSWYDIVEKSDDLDQGDFIDDCEFVIPEYILIDPEKKPSHLLTVLTEVYDVVIVSQSCDLENEKIDNVLVCPRWSYRQYIEAKLEKDVNFNIKDNLEQIRRGKEYRYYMLNQSNFADLSCDIQIVDFNIVFTIPYDTMKEMAKLPEKRLRLRSPYKEKLAQAFGYCHMRIGLSVDIPKFDKAVLAQFNPILKVTHQK